MILLWGKRKFGKSGPPNGWQFFSQFYLIPRATVWKSNNAEGHRENSPFVAFWFDWPFLRLWTLPGAVVVLVVVVLVVVDVTVVVVVVAAVVVVVVVKVVVVVAAVVFVQAWVIWFWKMLKIILIISEKRDLTPNSQGWYCPLEISAAVAAFSGLILGVIVLGMTSISRPSRP